MQIVNLKHLFVQTISGGKALHAARSAAQDKNFRIHYEKFRTLEDDEIAQVEHIFSAFDFSAGVQKTNKPNAKVSAKVKTDRLGEILQLLQYNVGLEETKELTVSLDKAGMGRFSVDKLVALLGSYSFQE